MGPSASVSHGAADGRGVGPVYQADGGIHGTCGEADIDACACGITQMTYAEQTLRVLPEVILAIAGTLIMVLSPVVKRARLLGYLALASLAVALGATVAIAGESGYAFSGQ